MTPDDRNHFANYLEWAAARDPDSQPPPSPRIVAAHIVAAIERGGGTLTERLTVHAWIQLGDTPPEARERVRACRGDVRAAAECIVALRRSAP
jgi:hypothetical protein